MLKKLNNLSFLAFLLIVLLLQNSHANADVITEWNLHARTIVVDAKLNTPFSNRALAIVHTAIFDAVSAIGDNSSIEAAVAAASRITLLALVPQESESIENKYQMEIGQIPQGDSKNEAIKIGEMSAKKILSTRLMDNSDVVEHYRPTAIKGKYVPTVIPAVPHWTNRKPWLMTSSYQFRPDPPPAINSKKWAKDLNEVQSIGQKNSQTRSAEQTQIAKFWEATLPPIYHGVVHSVANIPGRTVAENARLFAAITRATDDAMISVFDGKYHYDLWRPITAIRNADKDGNDETTRDATWQPYIKTPMHPEYPCAHCVVAGTVGTLLQAEIDKKGYTNVVFTTKSSTANNAIRSWNSINDFIQEVSEARIYDGVHYRTSTEVGTDMGKQIGAMAAKEYLLTDK